MIYIAYLQHPDFGGGKMTYQPSQFSGQKGKQTFIFLGLTYESVYLGLCPFFFLRAIGWPSSSTIKSSGSSKIKKKTNKHVTK